jgi:thiol-disulfide isomerase/thioredoxin
MILSGSSAHALNVGDAPADFTLTSNKGTPIQLSSLKGKIVYVDFWASWCVSCAQSSPWLSELQKKIGADKFQILAVNLDEHSEKGDEFLKKTNSELLVGYDPKGKIPETFQMKAMPTSYLLGKDGKIIYIHEGFKQKDADEIESQIKKAL